MEVFAPVLMMFFLWAAIGIPLVIARNQAEQKKKAARRAAQVAPAEDQAAAVPAPAEPERLVPLAPSVYVTGHDDTVYQGSLNAVTGEGFDPCHEEQLSSLDLAEQADSAPAEVRSGLPLGWTNNDVVRGIVMSEILNRKPSGK